jgi:hypothetical protein
VRRWRRAGRGWGAQTIEKRRSILNFDCEHVTSSSGESLSSQ